MKHVETVTQSKSIWTELAFVVGGAILLTAASKVNIPLKPVAVTLQPTAVLLLALTYRSPRAIQSVLLWLGMGAIGLPVFTGMMPGYVGLVGPSAGYLFSYIFIATLVPYLRARFTKEGWLFDMGLCGIATVINFGLGMAWLSTFVGFEQAVALGLVPFILPGLIKAGLLCGAVKAVRSYKVD